MFTAKFRARCAVVSSALTVAIVLGPMTSLSQATPKTGHGPSKLSAEQCQSLQDVANQDSDAAADAYAAGKSALGKSYEEQADLDFQTARAGGCAWAIWRVLPSGLGSSGGRATFGG
jgi:hypothetical protein